MIQLSRVQVLRDGPPRAAGRFVLYWMQASQRVRFNHALEYAARAANELDKPLVVGFGLMDDYPEANERHYAFMLQGLRDVREDLAERGVRLVVRRGRPDEVAMRLGREAALIVCDRGYLRHQKAWRENLATRSKLRVVEVESDVVVPVQIASDHREYAARTIRPKILRHRDAYLMPLRATLLKHSSLRMKIDGDVDVSAPGRALAKLKIDRRVGPSREFVGGAHAGRRALRHFLVHHLAGYAEGRNEPAADATSHLSAYLHFGQLSPVEIAMAVLEADVAAADRDVYLEELIVRRELAVNFVQFCENYDKYESLPAWARLTLRAHKNDPRPRIYSRRQLEAAATGDVYWNAAQTEMVTSGFMHNSMRMYWGKQVLQWRPTAQEAYRDLLHLNNKYFLDGRDPVSFANVAWIFGLHDRPWTRRAIFGTVRYMNTAGLLRKFDMEAYLERVAAI